MEPFWNCTEAFLGEKPSSGNRPSFGSILGWKNTAPKYVKKLYIKKLRPPAPSFLTHFFLETEGLAQIYTLYIYIHIHNIIPVIMYNLLYTGVHTHTICLVNIHETYLLAS